MTLFVRDVAIYWLNALRRPNKKTMKGNKNQKLVDLNQDLPYFSQSIQSRLGPQYVQQKMARLRPISH